LSRRQAGLRCGTHALHDGFLLGIDGQVLHLIP
jgi:hypothetical protein